MLAILGPILAFAGVLTTAVGAFLGIRYQARQAAAERKAKEEAQDRAEREQTRRVEAEADRQRIAAQYEHLEQERAAVRQRTDALMDRYTSEIDRQQQVITNLRAELARRPPP